MVELLAIVEQFATDWDSLARLLPDRPDYRLLIAVGVFVSRYAVVGQLASDGAIELIQLDVDLGAET